MWAVTLRMRNVRKLRMRRVQHLPSLMQPDRPKTMQIDIHMHTYIYTASIWISYNLINDKWPTIDSMQRRPSQRAEVTH